MPRCSPMSFLICKECMDMSERYTKLFTLSVNLYTAGAPVLVAAGALLKDNQTGRVLAQLKFQNIGAKIIKAVCVKLAPMDTMGKPLGEEVTYQYLDLNAVRDAAFGQKTPVPLPNAATRSFSVQVTEVIFLDNTIWTDMQVPWEPLREQETLEEVLGDEELVKQYRLQFGLNCHYQLTEERGLWRCTCGGFNRQGESACHICDREFHALSAVTVDKLTAARDARLAAEKRKAAEERAKSAKVLKIVIPVVVLLAVAVGMVGWMSGKSRNQQAVTNQTLVVTAVPTMKTPYEQMPEPSVNLNDFELLPNSNTQYLTEADLAALTWEELCFARNEIFARHGRIFTTYEIARYFEQKTWYQGIIAPEDFREDALNSIERANVQYIMDYEVEHYGGSYY